MAIFTNPRLVSGVFWSFLSAFLWATVYIVVRKMLGQSTPSVDPISLACLRFGIGGLLFFIFCLFFKRKEIFSVTGVQLLKIAVLSLFSIVGMSVFLFMGQQYTSAINSSVIMSCSPVLIMLFSLCIGEKLSWRQVFGIALTTYGCIVLIGGLKHDGFQFSLNTKGDLLCLGAAVSWAIAAVYAKTILKNTNELAVTVWSMLFATVIMIGIVIVRWNNGTELPSPDDRQTWLFILYLAIFPTLLGFFAWNAAISRAPFIVVNIMQYLTPLMTAVIAVSILGESKNWFEITGALLIILGIIEASTKNASKAKT